MDGHIESMARQSNRERILSEGLKVVHQRGFAGASVRDIVQAAGVPQGSFTNHFASKEAFGLEIIDRYFEASRDILAATLGDRELAPLRRLEAYVDATTCRGGDSGVRHGCLLGNFTAEASEHSEAMRGRLVEIFAEVRTQIAGCLAEAVKAGDLPQGFDAEGVAGFILASLQGAILLAKAERSPEPVEQLKQVLFASVLKN